MSGSKLEHTTGPTSSGKCSIYVLGAYFYTRRKEVRRSDCSLSFRDPLPSPPPTLHRSGSEEAPISRANTHVIHVGAFAPILARVGRALVHVDIAQFAAESIPACTSESQQLIYATASVRAWT